MTALEVARVVGVAQRCLERDLAGLDEVAGADLVGRQPGLARDVIDEALHQVGRLGPAGAAIGVGRHGVGHHALDVHVDRGRLVEADQHRGAGQRRDEGAEMAEIGAERRIGRDAAAEKLAVLVDGHLGDRDMVAALHVGLERLLAIGDPLHGALQQARGPHDHGILGMHEDLHAEAAADVAGAHAKLGRADLQDHVGHHRPDHVTPCEETHRVERSLLGVVLGDGAARLHRVHHQPLVDELQLDHAVGLGEGGVGGGGIAHLPVEDDVVLDVVVHQRRARLGCLVGADDVRPGRVVDLDQLGRVLGLLQRLGHHQRHRIADMAHPVLHQHRPRGLAARAAVAVLQRHQAGHVAEVGLLDVLRRSAPAARPAPWRRPRCRPCGCRHGRAASAARTCAPPGLQLGVVRVTPAARQQTGILEPANRLADTELRHEFLRSHGG